MFLFSNDLGVDLGNSNVLIYADGKGLVVREPSVVAVLASVNGGKITFQAVCGPEAVKRGIKAGELVRQVCGVCGGKGGGKPDSAMGGGSDLLKVDDALAAVDDFVSEKLG